MARPDLRALTAALVALAVLAACGTRGEESSAGGSDAGSDSAPAELSGSAAAIDPPFQLPDPRLTDTDGQPYRLASDTDAPLTLLFFGYSNCEDICGIVLQSIAAALHRLDPAQREQVEMVLVTSDPKRDTPEVLRSYLDQFDPSFTGLTGDLGTIVETGRSVGIHIDDGEQLDSGGYDPGTHGTRILAIDADDEVPVMWDQTTSSAEFAEDIRTLLEGETA